MNYRKQGLKVLGLSLMAAFSLMALAATGAQASGKVLVEGLTAPFTVGIVGQEENALEGRVLILGLNMEIFCHEATISGTLTSAGHGSGTLTLSSCLTQGTSGGSLTGAVCQIPNVVAQILALIILHSGNTALTTAQHGTGTGSPYVLFTPQDGLTFAKVLNHTECGLPEIMNVKGCMVARVATAGDLVKHLISTKAMLSLFGCKLSYGANEGHLEIDALVELTNSIHGNHAGLKWGVE
jgi:hypothetical protein